MDDQALLSFGLWIKRRRKVLDLTQDALAALVGCSKDLIVKIEGDARRPSREVAALLATHLQLALEERDDFIRCARAELAPDRLPPPARSVLRAAFVPAAPVLARPPTQIASPLPSGTITFLFTDIAGSTRLWEQHAQAMPAAIERHNDILAAAITTHGGTVFKLVGDAVCAAFASAPEALAAGLVAQRALVAEHWGTTGPLRVRMALHTGTATAHDGDYLGLPLNRVARLLAAGHGVQILLSLATQELVRDQLPAATGLRDLGIHRLKDLSRPEHIYQVEVPDLPSDFPSLRTLDARLGNVPIQPTPLIGRARELAQVAAILSRSDVRLVTLTGPGGTGKTRLGLQVGAELLDHFSDGVFFVNLAPITDPMLVAAAVAQTLGMLDAGNVPIQVRLKSFVQTKELLLLLDNFEQVVAAASLVAELLTVAPGLKVLVTSRVVLHLLGEHEYAVPPLALPPTDGRPFNTIQGRRPTTDDQYAHIRMDTISQYAAVALFIARAQAAKVDFVVTNATAPAVAEICVRLDGLPLAIELAAARIKLFPPDALLARLHSPLAVLTGGARDLPLRQQTIRSTIDWSYNLLSADETAAARRLGVFVGGFTLAAAEFINDERRTLNDATAEALDRSSSFIVHPSSFELLAVLLDQSLLILLASVDDEPRFGMLELVREYALDRLRAAGEETEMGHRHAAYLFELVETVVPKLGGLEMRKALEQLEAELPNLRAAFAWFEKVDDHDLALRFAGTLLPFWVERGKHEGCAMLQAALSWPGAGPPIMRAWALNALGRLRISESAYWPETIATLEESLAIFRDLSDLDGSAEVLDHLQLVAGYRGDIEQAIAFEEASLRDSRAARNADRTAWALANLADFAFIDGDDVRANVLLDECLELFKELKYSSGHAYGLLIRAWAIQRRGDGPQAVALFTEIVELLREAGRTGFLALALLCLGQVVLSEGDHALAVNLLEESLAVHREVGEREADPLVLHTLGEAALIYGDLATARARFRESQVLCRKLGNTWHSAGALLGEGHVACAEGDTGAANQSYTEALTIFAGLPSWDDRRRRAGIAACLASLAGAAARTIPERATRLYGAAAALRATVGKAALAQFDGPFRLPSNRTADERGLNTAHAASTVDKRGLDTARAALGDAAFDAAWAEGQALTLEQAVAEALNL